MAASDCPLPGLSYRHKPIGDSFYPHKKKGKQALLFDEWDKLAKEERLYVQEIEVEENNHGGIR